MNWYHLYISETPKLEATAALDSFYSGAKAKVRASWDSIRWTMIYGTPHFQKPVLYTYIYIYLFIYLIYLFIYFKICKYIYIYICSEIHQQSGHQGL